jgi:uncharacterized protein (TIGR02271 family)
MASYDTTSTTGASGAAGDASHLGRLNDLDEFKVADGYPDIRGWDVKTSDGQTVGKVGDLIVDTQQMRVRYLDVEIDRTVGQMASDAATPGDQEAHTLLPIGNVELDDSNDDVRVSGYTLQQIAGLPRYGGQRITSDYETTLRDRHRGRSGVAGGVAGAAATAGAAVAHGAEKVKDAVTGNHYDHDDYDDQRLYAKRRQAGAAGAGMANTAGMADTAGARQGEQRLTLAEEQLAVGKRQASAGEVELRKTVDTERVQEQVQLRHDEVSVERRPITDPSQVGAADNTIGEDEVRVVLMEEQTVVSKVMVPREEIIVRKNQVTENQTVSADLRRERLDTSSVDQQQRTMAAGTTGATGASQAGMSGAQDRATDSGLLDRAADKLDDLKDRVDGNPASRPGPDATDRRI